MALLLDFLIAMLVTSAVLWAAGTLFLRLDQRAEHWACLWALGLGLCVMIPLLGVATRLLPDWAALPMADMAVLHLPLIDLTPTMMSGSPDVSGLDTPLRDGMLVAALSLYLLGAALRASILIVGRWQLGQMVAAARPFDRHDGVEVCLSVQTRSAFAWMPFERRRSDRPSRARIVIPVLYVDQMNPEQISDIITHERAHINRHDDRIGLILRGLICLCWVTPFAHSLFARWSQAAEIQCDMAVTDGRPTRMRKAYAETLLQALHIVAGRVRQYPAASFSTPRFKNSLRNEKMRIAHIVNGTRPSFKRGRDRITLALGATCLTVAGTLGIAATAVADTPSIKPVNQVNSAIVTGRLTATFGKSYDPFRNGKPRLHKGVDIAAPIGTPIYAPAAGTIQAATELYDNKPGYGTVVVLQSDNGVTTLFSHLGSYLVAPGQRVDSGQQIATVGNSGRSTGPHVHIETSRNDIRIDPMTVWDLAVD